MNWSKLLFVVMIVLLYIPMVFLGANVFFPQYTGQDSYYQYSPGKDCYTRYPIPTEKLTTEEEAARQVKMDACFTQQQEEQRAFDKAKNAYEGQKYTFIAIFNLIVLLIALVWVSLTDTIMMALFLGSVLATFIATMRFFDTNSKVGFGILVVTFFTALFFINRKRATLFSWATTKKK